MMGLVAIIIGGFFEPAWVFALDKAGKQTERSRLILWYILFFIFSCCSLFGLSIGMKTEAVGISYAIWTAVGAITTITISRLFYKEELNRGKIVAIILILIGISGIEFAGGLA